MYMSLKFLGVKNESWMSDHHESWMSDHHDTPPSTINDLQRSMEFPRVSPTLTINKQEI